MRKRILQIFNRYLDYGGEEGSVYRIGDAMQELFDVEYYLSSTQAFLGSGVIQRIRAAGTAWANTEAAKRLERFQKLGNFDAWQIHNVFPALSPSVYAKAFQLGIPIIHYLHNYRMSCTNGFFLNHGVSCQRCIGGNFFPAFETACWRESHLQSGYMGLILKRVRDMGVFEKITAWIAISQAQKDIHVRMGIPPQNLHVVPHFYEQKDTAAPQNPTGSVLFVGRLATEKGLQFLLEAWALLGKSNRELIIMGAGPESAAIEETIQKKRLTNVRLTGFLNKSEQEEIWQRAAFIVVPSIWEEPFGMVVLEAWAQHRPVVAFRTGALAEIISDGHDGLLANPEDHIDLAEKIRFLLDNPQAVSAMGRAGYDRLVEFYNKERWLSQIKDVYNKALG